MAPVLLVLLLSLPPLALSKSTIEPCSASDSCSSLLGYTLYSDLKVSEVAALFQVDPLALLAANSLSPSPSPDAASDHILPAGLFLRVPTSCSCSAGVRRSVSVRYAARPQDSLASVAASVFGGLTSADQIRDANALPPGPAALQVGQTLVIPLHCACFNSSDNSLPAVYLSYVVGAGDTVPAIAAQYSTTVTDVMNVNGMGSPTVIPGDILAIPLRACASSFPGFTSDYGMIVANGTYAITAGRCVQCSCGPGNLNLFCTPTSLSVSCSSMQCSNSNLMLGNVTSQPTSAGCSVASCNYGGYANGSIITVLTTSLQPQCPGQHQFPPLSPIPTSLAHESYDAPSPSPAQAGGSTTTPKSSLPRSSSLPDFSPGSAPAGSTSWSPLTAHQLSQVSHVAVFFLVLNSLL